jgi:hypothetical protein
MTRTARPKLLLIAGVARSGSTALHFMLGNRPDSAALGEIYAWYRPFRPHHLRPNCSCGRTLPECTVWSQIDRPRARHLHRAVADTLGVDVVVDSSKSLSWIRDASAWARRDEMDVHVIVSWREAKATAFSYWRRGAPGWAENLEGYLRRLDDLDLPWRALPFDELIAQPESTLGALYEPLGLSYEPGQERFWEGEFHSLFGDDGTVTQVTKGSSELSPPQFPEDFEIYWSGLPGELHARMETIAATMRTGKDEGSTSRKLPPTWYLKNKAINARDRLLLRARPDAVIR